MHLTYDQIQILSEAFENAGIPRNEGLQRLSSEIKSLKVKSGQDDYWEKFRHNTAALIVSTQRLHMIQEYDVQEAIKTTDLLIKELQKPVDQHERPNTNNPILL